MDDQLKIPKDRLGFDFDGVIADTGETFVRLACENHGCCSFTVNDITSFEVSESLGIPLEVIEKIFEEMVNDTINTGLKPAAGAVEVLSELAETATVQIVTARPMAGPVVQWVNKFFTAETAEKIKVTATGSPEAKEQYLRELGIDYFIDDRHETCVELARKNITALVYSQPWNLGQHNLPMVENWRQIRERIDF
ncbi:MAG: hypothetical protein CSB24_02445 [Deltaproteobacteria bacterium]|nr:MAG: hypothetical protein CSB24_02445 [Deltaproteobacteria bacterium]